jgi:hypothetical protein
MTKRSRLLEKFPKDIYMRFLPVADELTTFIETPEEDDETSLVVEIEIECSPQVVSVPNQISASKPDLPGAQRTHFSTLSRGNAHRCPYNRYGGRHFSSHISKFSEVNQHDIKTPSYYRRFERLDGGYKSTSKMIRVDINGQKFGVTNMVLSASKYFYLAVEFELAVNTLMMLGCSQSHILGMKIKDICNRGNNTAVSLNFELGFWVDNFLKCMSNDKDTLHVPFSHNGKYYVLRNDFPCEKHIVGAAVTSIGFDELSIRVQDM